MSRAIAIVGMGGVFPGASSLEQFWENIASGTHFSRPIPPERWIQPPETMLSKEWSPDHALSSYACLIDSFQPRAEDLGIPEEWLEVLDPLYSMTLYAGKNALRSAKMEAVDRSRMGVILAAIALPTDGSSALTREVFGSALGAGFSEGGFGLPNALAWRNARVTSFPAALLAQVCGLGGGSYTLDAACASSLYSLKLACDELLSGRMDAMLAGGVSRPENLYTQVGFSQLRALSKTGRCAPFDHRGDGLVVGEGAGVLVLKRLEDAIAHGDTIFGTIRGFGLSNDIGGNLLAPDCEGQLRAMRAAYKRANWCPSDVDLIECHGTGTPLGDLRELQSLCTLWEREAATRAQCAIGSVKSMIGHLLTAASVAGVIKVLLALRHKTLPPSCHFERPSPKSPLFGSPFRVQKMAAPWEQRTNETPRRAAVSAFGFGGINAHMLLEEWNEELSCCQVEAKEFQKRGRIATKKEQPSTSSKDARSEQESLRLKKESQGTVSATYQDEPIAIVGIGAQVGACKSRRELEHAFFSGESLLRPRPQSRWSGLESWLEAQGVTLPQMGAFVESLEVPLGRFRLPPQEIPEILPQQLLMLETAAQSLEDAGLPLRGKHPNIGTFVGISFDLETTQFHLRWALPSLAKKWAKELGLSLGEKAFASWVELLREAIGPGLNATRTVGALGGIVGSRVAKEFGFGGPSFVLSGEEASGIRALEVAMRALRAHEIDAALVGAVDLSGDVRHWLANRSLEMFASSGEPRPFDQESEGMGIGEGAVSLVCKRLSDALQAGDKVYAIVRGMGSATRPDLREEAGLTDTLQVAMQRAYRDAQVEPHSISLLETHGTGASSDHSEQMAYHAFFAEHPGHCAIGTPQATTGHTGAVTGLLALVKASLSLSHRLLAPCPRWKHPATPWPAGFHAPRAPQMWFHNRSEGPRRAGVSCMTLDGNCTHVVLEESPLEPDSSMESAAKRTQQFLSPVDDERRALFVLEASSIASLAAELESLGRCLVEKEDVSLGAMASYWWARHTPNESGSVRAAFVSSSHEEASEQIRRLQNHLRKHPKHRLQGQRGLFFQPNPLAKRGRIAFVYPGSGNHYVGMGRGLGAKWPQVWQRLAKQASQLKEQMLPHLYAPWRSSWEDGWEREAAAALGAHAHSMIFGQVVHGGFVTEIVRQFGVKPDAYLGYSLGESAALFASGAWPEREQMRLRLETSPLFQTELAGPCLAARRAWGLTKEQEFVWKTVLVPRSAEEVRKLLRPDKLARLLIVNTPDECVLGGKREDVDEMISQLSCESFPLEGIVTVHCDALGDAEQDYFDLHVFPTNPPPQIAFYSGYYGGAYELSSESAADSITKQALYGFDYTRTIEQAYEDGVRIFVEMGPQGSCSRMIRKILQGREHLAHSACVRGEDDVVSVMKLMGALWVEGVALDLSPFFVGIQPTSKASATPVVSVPVGRKLPRLPMPVEPVERVEQNDALPQWNSAARDSVQTHESSMRESIPPVFSGAPSLEERARGEQSSASTHSVIPSIPGVSESPLSLSEPRPLYKAGMRVAAESVLSVSTSREPNDFLPLSQESTGSLSPEPFAPVSKPFPWESSEKTMPKKSEMPPIGQELSAHSMQEQLTSYYLDSVQSMSATMAQTIGMNQGTHQTYLELAQQGWNDYAEGFDFQNTLLSAWVHSQPRPNLQVGATSPTMDLQTPPSQTASQPEEGRTQTPNLSQGSSWGNVDWNAGQWTNFAQSSPVQMNRFAPQTPIAYEGKSRSPTHVASAVSAVPVAFDRDLCMEFAVGSLAKVLGPEFAEVDTYPVRVRLPDEPLMLVDRILTVEGEKGSLGSGRLVTEHDVLPGAWYLDGGRMPVCISVESGQADLFLCSYLGIDLAVKGKRAYRLLDAEIHFHRGLPQAGEVIRYDIRIHRFVRQGDVYLFFFEFDGTIHGQPFLTMRNGCAGFFTEEEVENSGGILRTEEDTKPMPGKKVGYKSLVPAFAGALNEAQVRALRRGDLGVAFGPDFATLPLKEPVRLPSGRMELFHRILSLEPNGGRFGLGKIRSQADIHPDDWFLTCHFVDDMVMPGTLMHECCSHTLRVLLTSMGWVDEHQEVAYEPVVGLQSRLRCRGPVTQETKHVVYEVEIKEIGYNPHPYVVADALIFADGKPVVTFDDMSMQMTGATQASLEALWESNATRQHNMSRPSETKPLFDRDKILAYAIGNPSEAFGEPYRVFDDERVLARLPGPPYLFLDRVTSIEPEPWVLQAGGWIEGEYDVPEDAWYFDANRQASMPFAVLLEIALQPCGWLAAYLGSALKSKQRLCFRNLGGEAVLRDFLRPDVGTLKIRVRMTEVSHAGGMIIERFAMEVHTSTQCIYEGNTYFGFFSEKALAEQVGILDAKPRLYEPTKEESAQEPHVLPWLAPRCPEDAKPPQDGPAGMPGKALCMVDTIEICSEQGGTHGLGFVRGVKQTDVDEWFFRAHFYQDPVCPGSLGLESFLQLLKYYLLQFEGEGRLETHEFAPILLNEPHRWVYRGQILPKPSRIEVDAIITAREGGDAPWVRADGFLKVNGLVIYEMKDFGIRLVPKAEKE